MQFLYLFLAHLTADFLMQPQKLVDAKHKAVLAVILHSFVHFLMMMLFLFPFWMSLKVLTVSAGVAVIHAIIDHVKAKAENAGSNYVLYFFIDQVAHISLLVMAAVLMSDIAIMQYSGWFAPLVWYLNPFVIAGICLLIIATYVYEVAAFQFARGKKKIFTPNRCRMTRHVMIVTVVYALIVLFAAHRIAAFALSPFLV